MQPSSFLPALRHRNFRLFFAGQSVSLIGTWMQQVAIAWVVYLTTDRNPLWLGVAAFSAQIPTFFLAPFAGVLVDRMNRHHLILFTQSLAMIQAVIVTLLAFTGLIEVWHIIVLNLFMGAVNACDIPARQAFLFDLVGESEDLSNAIALNSTMVNGARLIGPALAGLMLKFTSPATCFLVNASSYLAVLTALSAIRLPRPSGIIVPKPLWSGLVEGVRYAYRFPPIRALLLLATVGSFFGSSYMVLMPVFSTRILHGDETTLGFLHSAAGCGALLAAFLLATRKSIRGLPDWIAFAPAVLGLGLIGFSFSTWLWLSFLLVLINGFAVMTHMAATNTVLQSIVDVDKRGRVMSLYTVAFMGMIPMGSLLTGFLASKIGAPTMVRISGVCLVIGAVIFLLRLHRIRALMHPIRSLEASADRTPAIPTNRRDENAKM